MVNLAHNSLAVATLAANCAQKGVRLHLAEICTQLRYMKNVPSSETKSSTLKSAFVVPVRRGRGRRAVLRAPVRFNFFIEAELLDAMRDLDYFARKMGITRYTGGFIARKGIALFIKQEMDALKAAKAKKPHAKDR